MASRPPLPEFLWSQSIETDNYKDYQPWKPHTSIDGAICHACKEFCESVLHGNIFTHENWKHERPGHSLLTHTERYAWTSHYDGILTKLRASADGGCELCAVFVEIDRTSPKPSPKDTFPDEPANPEDICYRICIDRREESIVEVEASHSFAIEFYKKSTGPDLQRGYRSMGAPPMATPRLPKHVNFFFLRYADDTAPRSLYTEGLFHEDPRRKVVVEQSGWPILLAADAEDRGSVQALMRARKWIWQCLKTHPRCSREPAILPKRVIDIGLTPDSAIRLHIPDPEDQAVTPYVALSYSWGEGLPLRTTKENLKKHCEEIPFVDFPKTLQDALHVTRGLVLRYIWIDALCIVQDDAQDWQEQAALMGEIYQGSILNISATSSSSLDSGFLQRTGRGAFSARENWSILSQRWQQQWWHIHWCLCLARWVQSTKRAKWELLVKPWMGVSRAIDVYSDAALHGSGNGMGMCDCNHERRICRCEEREHPPDARWMESADTNEVGVGQLFELQ
ncbi:hypothetical protein ONS95_001025 [Cadophora gregata]|uniref:uncharacterized protein n=1 Tax=Cadophora gregata TaxID=51156 RepID=UPI0026DD3AC7|nr:uncharacterized protein ONS95_001025 [Cadophora gregata]KAK0129084.1 hypothetical protein ONS95_001025 [Cadophora gregata]